MGLSPEQFYSALPADRTVVGDESCRLMCDAWAPILQRPVSRQCGL